MTCNRHRPHAHKIINSTGSVVSHFEYAAAGNISRKVTEQPGMIPVVSVRDAVVRFAGSDRINSLNQIKRNDLNSAEYDYAHCYAYDALDRLLTRTHSVSGTATFEWDGMDMIREAGYSNQAAFDSAHFDTDDFVYGANTRYYIPNGELMSFEVNGLVYQVHQDALGSVRAISDPSGNVVSHFEYDAWGNLLPSSSDSLNFPYTFVGSLGVRQDTATGMYYMRQRWYDPTLGRFTGRDRLRKSNRYSYADNNPLRYIDPSGLDPARAPVSNDLAPVSEGQYKPYIPSMHPVTLFDGSTSIKVAPRDSRPDDPIWMQNKFNSKFQKLGATPQASWDPTYNCHGYTFQKLLGGHRWWMENPGDAQAILDKYYSLQTDPYYTAKIGDVVVWSGGTASTQNTHSATVSRIDPDGTVYVQEKTGQEGEWEATIQATDQMYGGTFNIYSPNQGQSSP